MRSFARRMDSRTATSAVLTLPRAGNAMSHCGVRPGSLRDDVQSGCGSRWLTRTAGGGVAIAEGTGSWADQLSARVERASVPAPLVYGAAWIVAVLIFEATEWAAGAVQPFTLHPVHVALIALGVFLPGLIGLFNRSAARAVQA